MSTPAHAAEEKNIISLAEYRQRVFPADLGPPPPSPCPAAARRPAAMLFTEAIGRRGASLSTIEAEPASLGAMHGKVFSLKNAA
jgi:hypothetical protein